MTRNELLLFVEYFFKLDDRLDADLDQLVLNHLHFPRKLDNIDALDLIEARVKLQEERRIRDDLFLVLQIREQLKKYTDYGVSKNDKDRPV